MLTSVFILYYFLCSIHYVKKLINAFSQGWEFPLHSSLFRSKSSFLKSDREQFALITHFKKERLWGNPTRCSLQNSDFGQIALVTLNKRALQANCSLSLSKKRAIRSKKNFHHVFDSYFTVFPPFKPKSELPLLLFALVLFTKERLWANCSHHSLQKIKREQFALF